MTRGMRFLGSCFLVSSILLLAFAPLNKATAEEAQVILACSPTWQAIDACQSSGGRFDTLHCKCVHGNATAFHPCALVCIDGFLDANRCRCVHPK
jgi:hypothetical protein